VNDLSGLRILVAEDETILSLMMEDLLLEAGATVIGPAPNVGLAMQLLQSEAVDGAVLDFNLGGEMIVPVADTLTSLGIPFVIVTGYGPARMSAYYPHATVLNKPIDLKNFAGTVFRSLKGVWPTA
jgi:DNA-binding NtrC family response regulator